MKTLVIGGGMSGLTYGIMSVKNGIETVICERNSRVGKKIAMTGNGKCNIGNQNACPQCFDESKIVRAVLSDVSVEVYKQFLQSCGIFTTCDVAGRMYPLSESATNVVDCLRYQFAKYGGVTLTDCEATSLRACKGGFSVNLGGNEQIFDKVVLACGSASSAAETCAKKLVGDYFTKLCPSLVPVKTVGMDKTLNGLRAKCNVTLCVDGQPVKSESGEVQFKDYGLSGICVYNLSATVARNIVRGKHHNYLFLVDLVPTLTESQLADILSKRMAEPKETLFYGILHNKLGASVVKNSQFSPQALAHTAKNMQFPLDKLLDYSMSQVTAGGIAEQYVNLSDLSTPNGIVAVGEVLDVDGICGGNNLYFAAASALYLFDAEQRKRAFNKL